MGSGLRRGTRGPIPGYVSYVIATRKSGTLGSQQIFLGGTMAAPKSRSRKIAAKKNVSKTAKSKNLAKKAVKPGKQAAARKKKAVKKKAAKKKIAAARKARSTIVRAMASPAVVELDQRIAIVRNNLRDLAELATASSGASNEELTSGRIADYEEQLRTLTRQREDLVRNEG